MRHAILGNGNLGAALIKECLKNNMDFKVFSTTTGWKYPTASLQKIHDYLPNHVWVTVGAGSVEQARTDYKSFVDLHIRLPLELAQTLNCSVALHLFSTDYCNVAPQSLYALSKKHMEEAVIMTQRPLTYIYRVGSLYGTAKPQKCFPHKILMKAGKKIALPPNCVCPTPVDWLAQELMAPILELEQFKELTPITIAPGGCVTVKEWGEMILGEEVDMAAMDKLRPMECTHKSDVTPSWLELWKVRNNL